MAGLHYPREAARLWRWTDCPLDETIIALAAGFAALPPAKREQLRASLTADDCYELFTFARRSALAALRREDQAPIVAALTALAMIPYNLIDYRDLTMAAGLVCDTAHRLKAPVETLAEQAARLADPDCAMLLRSRLKRKSDCAGIWGLRNTATSGGVVIFDTRFHGQSPQSDLADLALECARGIDSFDYEIDEITLDTELPPVWLGAPAGSPVARLAESLSGCVALRGTLGGDPDPQSSGQSLLVFLAETRSEGEAAAIARAAQDRAHTDCSQMGVASGKLCAVVIQRSWLVDTPPLESPHDLERLRPVFESIMA